MPREQTYTLVTPALQEVKIKASTLKIGPSGDLVFLDAIAQPSHAYAHGAWKEVRETDVSA